MKIARLYKENSTYKVKILIKANLAPDENLFRHRIVFVVQQLIQGHKAGRLKKE